VKRWITTTQLGDALAAKSPKVAKLSSRRRAEYARRLVERAERLESVRCSRREGRRLLVSVSALAYLLPSDVATVDRLDVEFGKLAQNQRALRRQVRGHTVLLSDHKMLLSDHARRLKIVEQISTETAEFQVRIEKLKAEMGRT
jgi:hypothetical protein